MSKDLRKNMDLMEELSISDDPIGDLAEQVIDALETADSLLQAHGTEMGMSEDQVYELYSRINDIMEEVAEYQQ